MAGPYTIATPVRNQPIPSAGFGQAVKDAINDLHSRVAGLETGAQAVIAWGRRTTTSSGSASATEVGVLRIDNIPVRSGGIYQVSTGPIYGTSSAITGTPSAEGLSVVCRYNLNAAMNVAATSASNKIGHMRVPLVITQTPTPPFNGFFSSNLDGYASVYLGFFRNSGSGTLTLNPTASDPLDMYVQYGGAAPTNTGTVL